MSSVASPEYPRTSSRGSIRSRLTPSIATRRTGPSGTSSLSQPSSHISSISSINRPTSTISDVAGSRQGFLLAMCWSRSSFGYGITPHGKSASILWDPLSFLCSCVLLSTLKSPWRRCCGGEFMIFEVREFSLSFGLGWQ